jgi:hypothetical protein
MAMEMHEADPDQSAPDLVERETEAAAEEAGRIGGEVPQESDDPAEQPLREAGQGEAEGFELAEERLEDVAAHGDQHRFPDRHVPPPEEDVDAEFGEPDEPVQSDT